MIHLRWPKADHRLCLPALAPVEWGTNQVQPVAIFPNHEWPPLLAEKLSLTSSGGGWTLPFEKWFNTSHSPLVWLRFEVDDDSRGQSPSVCLDSSWLVLLLPGSRPRQVDPVVFLRCVRGHLNLTESISEAGAAISSSTEWAWFVDCPKQEQNIGPLQPYCLIEARLHGPISSVHVHIYVKGVL